jgi:hypothetical protein
MTSDKHPRDEDDENDAVVVFLYPGMVVLWNRRPPRMHPGCADPLLNNTARTTVMIILKFRQHQQSVQHSSRYDSIQILVRGLIFIKVETRTGERAKPPIWHPGPDWLADPVGRSGSG